MADRPHKNLIHNHSGLSSEPSLQALIGGEAHTTPALMRALGHHPARLRTTLQINIVPDVTQEPGRGNWKKDHAATACNDLKANLKLHNGQIISTYQGNSLKPMEIKDECNKSMYYLSFLLHSKTLTA